MSDHSPNAALKRFRVLDLSRVRSGPTCTKQLADFGADVIKIESPPGDDGVEEMGGPRHGSDFINLQRNKRSITLNLKSAEAMDIFRELVRTADVVVENFRPDVKGRLGIDYESLKKINPRIILASISGFGQDGPYANWPGFDQIAQGMGGLMAVTGRPGEGPMRAGAAVADVTSGLLAALGVMTALLERETSGEGQWVQTNLLQAQIALLDFQAARYLIEGDVPQQVGNDHPTGMPTSAYTTQDGAINVSAYGGLSWSRFCKVIEREEWIERAEFKSNADRSRNRVLLNKEINEVLVQKDSQTWIKLFMAGGVPAGPIYTMDQVFADPQVQHLQAAAPLQHPALGEIKVVNQAIKLSRTPAAMTMASPELGQHTQEVLAELGFDQHQIQALRDRKVV